ncbi:hypothetical protein QE152_g171 [Popillia japonica]|uniref:Ig-like domain-containing protein n=1 Tax=Popillia japonica TaxID=7064 RepID=A0AAW1NKF1_POPJA
MLYDRFKVKLINKDADGVSLEGGTVEVSTDDNTTTSSLVFNPTASDHGLTLTCKASNQRIPMSELRDTWMLKVFYPPKVTLTLGQALDAGNIKEGDDVYFECHLIANPWGIKCLAQVEENMSRFMTGFASAPYYLPRRFRPVIRVYNSRFMTGFASAPYY